MSTDTTKLSYITVIVTNINRSIHFFRDNLIGVKYSFGEVRVPSYFLTTLQALHFAEEYVSPPHRHKRDDRRTRDTTTITRLSSTGGGDDSNVNTEIIVSRGGTTQTGKAFPRIRGLRCR
jgi:catechol 2,3-dioxygenase-like lactoylglutathione lyase family enzyme